MGMESIEHKATNTDFKNASTHPSFIQMCLEDALKNLETSVTLNGNQAISNRMFCYSTENPDHTNALYVTPGCANHSPRVLLDTIDANALQQYFNNEFDQIVKAFDQFAKNAIYEAHVTFRSFYEKNQQKSVRTTAVQIEQSDLDRIENNTDQLREKLVACVYSKLARDASTEDAENTHSYFLRFAQHKDIKTNHQLNTYLRKKDTFVELVNELVANAIDRIKNNRKLASWLIADWVKDFLIRKQPTLPPRPLASKLPLTVQVVNQADYTEIPSPEETTTGYALNTSNDRLFKPMPMRPSTAPSDEPRQPTPSPTG